MCNARWLVVPLLAVLMEAAGAGQNAAALYRDPGRPVDERVADLIGRMTVEEKVAQLEGLWKRNAQLQQPTAVTALASTVATSANDVA